jgi:hypothetical protein
MFAGHTPPRAAGAPPAAAMRKKVDQRIRTLVENCVTLHQRSMFVIVGDRGRDQARARPPPPAAAAAQRFQRRRASLAPVRCGARRARACAARPGARWAPAR